MKKLSLDMERLRVETFTTHAAAKDARGTVHAEAATRASNCPTVCVTCNCCSYPDVCYCTEYPDCF